MRRPLIGSGRLLLGGALSARKGLRTATRVGQVTGAKLLCETSPPNLERGAGLPAPERLGYLAELAYFGQLQGFRQLVLVDAAAPVSFFAYPNLPGYLVPEDCEVHLLAGATDDVPGALEALADELGAPGDAELMPYLQQARQPQRPSGALDAETSVAAIGALLPEGAIVGTRPSPRDCSSPRRRPVRPDTTGLPDGGRDRTGHAGGNRGCGRMPGSQGPVPRSRRKAPCTRCSPFGPRREKD